MSKRKQHSSRRREVATRQGVQRALEVVRDIPDAVDDLADSLTQGGRGQRNRYVRVHLARRIA